MGRGATSANHDQKTHRGQILEQVIKAPQRNQRRQRPTGRRQPFRAQSHGRASNRRALRRNEARQKRFRLPSRSMRAGGAETQQPANLRRRHHQADAQPEPLGVEFAGEINHERSAGQPVADRPHRGVPNRQPLCPAALGNRQCWSFSGRRDARLVPRVALATDAVAHARHVTSRHVPSP